MDDRNSARAVTACMREGEEHLDGETLVVLWRDTCAALPFLDWACLLHLDTHQNTHVHAHKPTTHITLQHNTCPYHHTGVQASPPLRSSLPRVSTYPTSCRQTCCMRCARRGSGARNLPHQHTGTCSGQGHPTQHPYALLVHTDTHACTHSSMHAPGRCIHACPWSLVRTPLHSSFVLVRIAHLRVSRCGRGMGWKMQTWWPRSAVRL